MRSQAADFLQYSLADAYSAWNWLDEAAGALHETLRIGQGWQQVDLLIPGQLGVAWLALAAEELEAALNLVQRVLGIQATAARPSWRK